MNLKNLLQFVFVLFVGQFLFSCSSAEYYRFSAAKPEAYNKALAKTEPATVLKENTPTMAEASPSEIAAEPITVNEAEPTLEANAGAATPVLFETTKKPAASPAAVASAEVVNSMATIDEAAALESARERFKSMTKAEKKAFKKEVKEALRGTNAVDSVLLIILAILLPPLAVALHEGIGTRFWLSILLTLLFFVPGVIYALLVVTDSI